MLVDERVGKTGDPHQGRVAAAGVVGRDQRGRARQVEAGGYVPRRRALAGGQRREVEQRGGGDQADREVDEQGMERHGATRQGDTCGQVRNSSTAQAFVRSVWHEVHGLGTP